MGPPAGGLPAPQAPLRMGRASSAGIDALAEAAAAALAGRPDLLLDRSTASASAQQGEGAGNAEQDAGAGDGPTAARPTPHKKRAREQQSVKVEMGPPGSGYKRPCAGAGTNECISRVALLALPKGLKAAASAVRRNRSCSNAHAL